MKLVQQIKLLEEEIHKRRSKIRTDLGQVNQEIRHEFASRAIEPKVLLAALAAGFASDQLSRGKLPVISFLRTLQAALVK